MQRKWLAIAKAEFLVQTAKLRGYRKLTAISLAFIGIIWAVYLAPHMMLGILGALGPGIDLLVVALYPGLMRSVLLLIWLMVLLYPISYALQEIRIGQWELMLSNNVRTRDILIGSFVGKIPSYMLLVLFMAPILLAPFVWALNVTLIGQLIMYATIFLVAISTLWLSTILSTAIQAKLGDSARGNDIAKGLGIVIALIFLVPIYGLTYFSGPLSEIMGMDAFMILPSSWGADFLTWTALTFNESTLPPVLLSAIEQGLGLGPVINISLTLIFSGLILALGFVASDRLFQIQSGARTESITTVGEENFFLRALRRRMPGPSGVLIVTTLKEFSRKVQNVSRIAYGVFLSILLPVMINIGLVDRISDPTARLFLTVLMVGFILGMISSITFGGIGFLESKDQLWIIRSAPNGAKKYVLARIAQTMLIALPMAMIPSVAVALVMNLDLLSVLIVLCNSYVVVIGAVLIAIGITTINPAYDNIKSGAFYVNTFTSIFLTMAVYLGGLLLLPLTSDTLGIVGGLLFSSLPLILVGSIICWIGTWRLSLPE